MSDQAAHRSERRISIGECLDQLLNRECRLPFERDDDSANTQTQGKYGGLVCPSKNGRAPGTGNIVIKGSAGTGKSTLALQIAVEAARRNENVNTAYISLEETSQQVLAKAEMFGWQYWLTPLRMRPCRLEGQHPSRDELRDDLNTLLSYRSFGCPNNSQGGDQFHKSSNCLGEIGRGSCEYQDFKSYNDRECHYYQGRMTLPVCGGSCGIKFDNHVLLPCLEARVFEPSDNYEKHDRLFWIRMGQLEDLLHAACQLNDEANDSGKRLDIVCIDSLNVLGQGHLTRDHLSALFDLFRRNRVIGVFVYEQLEHDHRSGRFDHSLKDIEFLADTVIDLTGGEHQGYWVRHLHISKSRHQHQVLGRHPFKIIEDEGRNQPDESLCPHLITTRTYQPLDRKETRVSRFGIRVFPSIHTVIRASKPKRATAAEDKTGNNVNAEKVFFQDKNLNNMGGQALKKQGGPTVATVSGPPVAGKSVLAFNFLIQGIIEGKNGILITLGETSTFHSGTVALGDQSANSGQLSEREKYFKNCKLMDLLASLSCEKVSSGEIEENACRVLRYVAEEHKAALFMWNFQPIGKPNALPNYIVEMVLKPGALLPEEVASLIRHIYGAFTLLKENRYRDSSNWPKRAVLQNVNRIGFEYPFLREATTGPELFLPGLAHLFHCRNTDLLITAPTGGVTASSDVSKQAIELAADAALECSHLDVFGDRYVTITGPGLIERDTHSVNAPEGVPGVLKLERKVAGAVGSFKIDMDALSDLVGFATGDIRRPGVLLQLFEEGGLHKKYNHQVKRLVQFAMGDTLRGDGQNPGDAARVCIDTFDSREASAFHRSLSLLRGAPLSMTVIRTVDEFAYTDHVANSGASQDDSDARIVEPSSRYENVYYRNVLLFLCDNQTYVELIPLKRKLEETRLRLQLVVGFESLRDLVADAKKDIKDAAINAWHIAIGDIMQGTEQIVELIRKVEQDGDKEMTAIDDIGRLKSLLISLQDIVSERNEDSRVANENRNRYVELLPEILTQIEEGQLQDELRLEYRKTTLDFWNKMEELTRGAGGNPMAFLYDERATETLASLALDGVLSLAGCHRGELDMRDYCTNKRVVDALQKNDSLRRWVDHLSAVMKNAKPLMLNDPQCVTGVNSDRKERVSSEVKQLFAEKRRFVLLAWYSQIRELIDHVGPHDETGSGTDGHYMEGLKVLPLPAGGVKGDWYLQAPSGSVSISLGRKICRQLLDPSEDFKRFMDGVGLPSWPRSDSEFDDASHPGRGDMETGHAQGRFMELKKYSEKYPELLRAWPGSKVSLQAVLSLHRFAHRRSDIKGYKKINDELYSIMNDIIQQRSKRRSSGEGWAIKNHKEMIIRAIERLRRSDE